MKIIVILFLILILLLSVNIRIDIKKLSIENTKIKLNIIVKIYILKHIKIFQKKITKKDIKKIIEAIKKTNIKKDEKIFRKLLYTVTNTSLEINYGLTNIFANIYLYAIINELIPTMIAKNQIKKREYKINTDFKRNYFKLRFKSLIEISVLKNIIRKRG